MSDVCSSFHDFSISGLSLTFKLQITEFRVSFESRMRIHRRLKNHSIKISTSLTPSFFVAGIISHPSFVFGIWLVERSEEAED